MGCFTAFCILIDTLCHTHSARGVAAEPSAKAPKWLCPAASALFLLLHVTWSEERIDLVGQSATIYIVSAAPPRLRTNAERLAECVHQYANGCMTLRCSAQDQDLF